ncbi:hypothetical protein [Burkholderia pseudomallei]
MLEPTPAALDEVVVNLLPGIEEQKKYSEALRKGRYKRALRRREQRVK